MAATIALTIELPKVLFMFGVCLPVSGRPVTLKGCPGSVACQAPPKLGAGIASDLAVPAVLAG